MNDLPSFLDFSVDKPDVQTFDQCYDSYDHSLPVLPSIFDAIKEDDETVLQTILDSPNAATILQSTKSVGLVVWSTMEWNGSSAATYALKREPNRCTPLVYALYFKRRERALQILASLYVVVSDKSNASNRPLSWAVKHNFSDVVAAIIRHPTFYCRTPLVAEMQHCVENNCAESLQLLHKVSKCPKGLDKRAIITKYINKAVAKNSYDCLPYLNEVSKSFPASH